MSKAAYIKRLHRQLNRWEIAVQYHSFIGKTFRSRRHLDKAVDYMNKRWKLAIYMMRNLY